MTTYDITDADFDNSASDVAVERYTINAGEADKMQTLEQYANKYQNLNSWDMELIQTLRRVDEYEKKISLYKEEMETYKEDLEIKRSDLKSQMDFCSAAIKSIKNQQSREDFQKILSQITERFNRDYTAMTGKFVKAGIASSRLEGAIGEFRQAIEFNAENAKELQKKIEENLKKFYDNFNGIDIPHNTKSITEKLLKAKLTSINAAIEANWEA